MGQAAATPVQVDPGTPPELPNESSHRRFISRDEAQDEDSPPNIISVKRIIGKEKFDGEQFSDSEVQQVANWPSWWYTVSEERNHSQEKVDGDNSSDSEVQQVANWAQQTEQGYNLQSALAQRVTAEAELISETRLIGKSFQDEISCSAARRSVETTSHRFWVNGSMGYNDVIQDGFYRTWGMSARVWAMCNEEGNKMPSLESLRAVNPADSSFEVVLVDKNGDSNLRELVREVQDTAKSLSPTFGEPDLRELAGVLGNRVCNLLGGEASHEHGDLTLRWEADNRRLRECLSTIVLPLGNLSVGLCRHRALLFKTLADSVKLPCRIARGCKYCGSDDGLSCMVLCEPDRDYYVDLVAKPGCLSSPDTIWTNSPWSFCSPVLLTPFQAFKGSVDDSQYRPKQWFPSGSAEMTFKDDKPGHEVWAVLKVSEERAYNVFKDQLEDKTRKGREPAKDLSSEKSSFIVGINPNSMKGLNLQEEDPFAANTPTGDGMNLGMGEAQLELSPAAMKLERMSSDEDFVIQWEELTLKGRVGSGSFGTVWLGNWHGSDVAVKVLMKQDLRDEQLNEFLREVEIMKRLRHPNIVLFMGAVTVPPKLSIVTEYLPRGSLFRILQKPSMKQLQRRLGIALDVAKAMNYLHCCNPPIVHRDLKSANILVDTLWTAKVCMVQVCDFGLSKFKPDDFLTPRSARGTPAWMAPEVLMNEPSNEKADVYSFGVVFWELMTMKIPWDGLNEFQIMAARCQHRRLDTPEDLDPDLAAIMEACFALDPHDRPSFADIMESLKEFKKKPPAQPPPGPSSSSPKPSI